MRRPLFIANWKMHKTAAETQLFARTFELSAASPCDVVICAPFTALPVLTDVAFDVGAQNFYPEASGAYTGEISLAMLSELGVTYVLTGHSERRQLFRESDALIAEKYRYAAAHGFYPVLCVGEPEDVRSQGQAVVHCTRQLAQVFSPVETLKRPEKIIIAYEPIWAIGTGKTATPEDAQDMCAHLRNALSDLLGESVAQTALFLYGGSVKTDNIASLMMQPDVDGVLVGGASLEAEQFAELIKKGCAVIG